MDSKESLANLTEEYMSACRAAYSHPASANVEKAITLGQNLLPRLHASLSSFPLFVEVYSLCSLSLAQCLFITWQKTGAEAKRDRELLSIIASRVDSAVATSGSTDQHRALCLQTQQTYYCIVRNFSARLEDDFWNDEHINTLNAAMTYAKSAWSVLCDNANEARNTAYNLGNLYMSRYEYLGRSGDIDDALKFSTMSSVLSRNMASKFQVQSYIQQAARKSRWSSFEDHPDEIDDAIDNMNKAIQGKTWEVENRGVTAQCGSGYAFELSCFSEVYCRAFKRRMRQSSSPKQYLDHAVQHSQNAHSGALRIDPGNLLFSNQYASAQLQVYLLDPSVHHFQALAMTVLFALNLAIDLLASCRIPRRRAQRWALPTLEISADLLLARYEQNHQPQDLATAITALKLCIQGTHSWSPARSKLLFKLNQSLCEKLRRVKAANPNRMHNFLYRLNKTPTRTLKQRLKNIDFLFEGDHIKEDPLFQPLARSKSISSSSNIEPLDDRSWQRTTPRGAYELDMQLSTDATNILISDLPSCTEQIHRALCRLDSRVDCVLKKLHAQDHETPIIQNMWNKLYCSAGASLKRAEMYQIALLHFVNNDNLEAAEELADLAEPVLGHLELYLMEPEDYLSDLSHASNLAATIACIWLAQGRDPWKAILALENGRELGSRHGMNAVRSYTYEPLEELVPTSRIIRDRIERSDENHDRDISPTNEDFTTNSENLVNLLNDVIESRRSLVPFGRQQCMWQASDAFIIHLVTSKLGTFALITSSGGFQSLPLPSCPNKRLNSRVSAFRRALKLCEDEEGQKGVANDKLRGLLAWLWKTVVKPIVEFLHLKKSNGDGLALPRIKWVACGIFSQLPIHAAGAYYETPTDYLDQYAVSSYLSSIRASIASQQRKPLMPYYQNANREFTLFGMSTSPSVPEGALSDLAVLEERDRIFSILGDSFVKNTIDQCNIGMARNMMRWARMIHFTCHGIPHPTNPSNSRLVLLADDKEPCTVAKILDMNIPNALLLFLSACHSAIDPRAGESDEITHLAKAFLLTGFPNVIGTLWKAYEMSAVEIASEFYAGVAKGWTMEQEEPDSNLFAAALHHAVCKWREDGNMWKPMDWASWVCFSS